MFNLDDNRSQKAFVKKFKIDGNGVPNICRILDYNNPVTYYEAWIVCDDGEKRPFIYGLFDKDKTSHWNVLMDIVGDPLSFFKGGFLNSRMNENKEKVYVWEKKAPQVFNMVKFNDDLTGENGGWEPKQIKAWECIARGTEKGDDSIDFNWCVRNNKTQVLAISAFMAKDLKILEENAGNPDDYDVNVVKTGSGKNGTRYTITKIEKTKSQLVVVGGLTPEEQKYERWNLNEEFKPTPSGEILDHLEKKITMISEAMGIDFIGKLYEETGRMPSVSAKATPSRLASEPAPAVVAPVAVQVAAPVAAPAPVTPVAQEVAPVVQPSGAVTPDTDDSAFPADQPDVALPSRTVAAVVAEEQLGDTVECIHCHKQIPAEAVICPDCKKVVAGPCGNCKVVSSLTLKACPSCGLPFS